MILLAKTNIYNSFTNKPESKVGQRTKYKTKYNEYEIIKIEG